MTERTISSQTARRLAITKQRLAGARPPPTQEGITEVARSLRCLQLDPISVVARSHQLVLWSRLGPYDLLDLDRLLWEERSLFEYWAHAASIVLTEDYPIHRMLMRKYATTDRLRHQRLRIWLSENEPLRRHILTSLRRKGALRSRDFEGDQAERDWHSGGWTSGRNVNQMLDYLWTKGRVMVARRNGLEKWWDLAERCLPEGTPRDRLSDREVTRRAAQHSLRALGIGTSRDIQWHFTAGRYPGLPAVLRELERAGLIVPVRVRDDDATVWPERRFVHAEDLPLLQRLERDDGWKPRATLLSPFDNLIINRARTEELFGFHFRMEIYVPASKRRYGYYVLPILLGDSVIGRIDPAMDRRSGVFRINAVHAEPGAPLDRATGGAIRGAVQDLATFLGAREIAYPADPPKGWRAALR